MHARSTKSLSSKPSRTRSITSRHATVTTVSINARSSRGCSKVSDVKEAEDYYVQAEALFHIVRAWHVIGGNTEGDSHLNEASGVLDETSSVLLEVSPNGTFGRHGHIEERERRTRERYKVDEGAKRSSKGQETRSVDSCILE